MICPYRIKRVKKPESLRYEFVDEFVICDREMCPCYSVERVNGVSDIHEICYCCRGGERLALDYTFKED